MKSDLEELLELYHFTMKRMIREWDSNLPGISNSQYHILRRLGKDGPQKAAHLAEMTQITPGAVTSATDRLVTEGYLERHGDSGDRRIVYLAITEKGRELVETLNEQYSAAVIKFFEGLPEEDLQHLIRIHRKIAENLGHQ